MKTFVALTISFVLLFMGNLSAATQSNVDQVMDLLSKELSLKATQKPTTKEVVSQYASKFSDLAKSSMTDSAKLDAENALFDHFKGALGKVLSTEQLAKLDGLKTQIMALFGLKL